MPIPCPKKFKPKATDKVTWEQSVEITAKLYPQELKAWIANPAAKVSEVKRKALESIMSYLDNEPTGISRMFNFNILSAPKKSYQTCLEIFYKADLPDELFMLHVINQIELIQSPDSDIRKTLGLARKWLNDLIIPYQNEMKKSIAGLGIVIVATVSSCLSLKSITYAGYALIPIGVALGVSLLLSDEFIKWRLQEALKDRFMAANVIQAKIDDQARLCQRSGTPLHKLDTTVQATNRAYQNEYLTLMTSPVHDSWSRPIEILNEVTDITSRICVSGFSIVRTRLLMWEAKLHRNTQPPAYASIVAENEEAKDNEASRQARLMQ